MRERLLWAHVWLAATFIPLLVRLLPLRWVLWALTPPANVCPYAGLRDGRIVERVRRRLRSPRIMRRRVCLREGLMLFHFLRLAGRRPVLRFAVYRTGGSESERQGGSSPLCGNGAEPNEPKGDSPVFATGLKRERSPLRAHCWVTLNDVAVSNEPQAPHAVLLTVGQDAFR